MIFVTGATGNVGSPLVAGLRERRVPHLALSRTPPTDISGETGWVQGGFDDEALLRENFKGVRTVVLISPAHERMVEHQTAVVRAAAAAGVQRLVKLSGLGASVDAPARLPQRHAVIEAAIVDSGLSYTFVRPNLFMQVLLGSKDSIAGQGAIYAPAGEGPISFTDVRDVADVMLAAALDESRQNQAYDITGPEALSYGDAAQRIGRALGRSVRHVNVSPEQARESMLASGMSVWLTEAFIELFSIYRAGMGSSVLSQTIEKVTGKPARTFADFLADFTPSFRAAA